MLDFDSASKKMPIAHIISNDADGNQSGLQPDALHCMPRACLASLSSKHGHNLSHDHRVRINVSGSVFETYMCILENFPDTLLGNKDKRKSLWDGQRKEYFIEGNALTFEAIFQFYQSGYLKRPMEVPLATFLEQLELFQMDGETMEKFCDSEGLLTNRARFFPGTDWRARLWRMLECPDISQGARIVSMLSILAIVFSISLMCIETVPSVAVPLCRKKAELDENGNVRYKSIPNLKNEFFILDFSITIWFTVEFLLRIIACPSTMNFVKDLANIIDAIAIFPHITILCLAMVTKDCNFLSAGEFLVVLRIMRLMRIFKLTRYNNSIKLILHSFKQSFHYLIACLYVILISSLIFAFLLYWIEADSTSSEFKSIEEGLWWAFGSMATVGYGDVVPQSRAGRAVGCICITIGFIVMSLPSGIIVTNFNKYYRNFTGRGISESEMTRTYQH